MRLVIVLTTLVIAGCTAMPKHDATPPADATRSPGSGAIHKVELNDLAVWRYNPAADRWTIVSADVMRLVLFEPVPAVGATSGADSTKPLRATPLGLYWVSWTQDGVDRGAFIFRGPVQCNDLAIGDPPPGKVAACVPSQNSAKAQFVPDPRVYCKLPQTRATQPATTRTTQRVADSLIELHRGVYLMRFEVRTTISADGRLRSIKTTGKSYGPGDVDPKYERSEIRAGRLTPEQMADLRQLFANWSSLSTEPYAGPADDGELSIRYGDKTVSGGQSAMPKQVSDVYARIRELTERMPVVKP